MDGQTFDKKWTCKEKIRKNDDVVILPDLSWGNAEETNAVLKRLDGFAILTR
ncbi:MAG: hypothetical protein PHE06_02570 [Lachnospiraceae bacterium]|nr:hypothetical protein [Lachnospiraceae bacterium]MDD3794856.1 hypothetical protein [Lachnospiraceae bacterium]